MRRLLSTARVPFTRHSLKRTHTLGELSIQDVGKEVVLSGWLGRFHLRKDGFAFLELQDAHGRVQLAIQNLPEHVPYSADFEHKKLSTALSEVPLESVISVRGHVQERPFNTRREGATGALEVIIEDFEILNAAERELPFYPSVTAKRKSLSEPQNTELRYQHRYLDLRRAGFREILRTRSKVAQTIRHSLTEDDFVEVETPMLLRSSPEGAREFLVPARSSNNSLSSTIDTPVNLSSSSPSQHQIQTQPQFYALAQSPQQPKQLLIASGVIDKYYQFARCFRDEDGRKDRQPEFTQVDLEMGFVSWSPDANGVLEKANNERRKWRIGGMEVRDCVERFLRRVWAHVLNIELENEFKVMTYRDAMAKYGSDKPDTRFDIVIKPLQNLVNPKNGPGIELKPGHHIDCLHIRKADMELYSAAQKGDFSQITNHEVEHYVCNRLTPLDWMRNSPILREALTAGLDGTSTSLETPFETGDIVFLALRKGEHEGSSTRLGHLRLAIFEHAQNKGFQVTKKPHFLWVTEFPLFTRVDDDKDFLARGRWSSSHHPFTAPVWEDIEKLEAGEYAKVRGQHYDLVLNGTEIGGGSVRIHDAGMQELVLKDALCLSDEERAPFETLLRALRSGAPPHGGIALGFDRLMTIICNVPSIRDVIAFPKTLGGRDLLFKSPSNVSDDVLAEYGLQSRRKSWNIDNHIPLQ